MNLLNDWKRFSMLKTLDVDPSGGGDEGGSDPNPSQDKQNGNDNKTFTQEQVNSMIAAEKRKNMSSMYKGLGFESEEQAKQFIEKYRQEEEKNKSDLVKEQEKSKQLEEEKAAADAKAQDFQYRFDAIAEGCNAKAAEDVVVLAKVKMSDGKDFASALADVKEQYPAMFGQSDVGNGTGSGGTSPRSKNKTGDLSGIGKKLAEQRKQNNTVKNNEYFK